MAENTGGTSKGNAQAIADQLGAVVPEHLLEQAKDVGVVGATDRISLSDFENFDDWQQPFYLKYRLVSLLGVVLSVAWIAASIAFVDRGLGWDNVNQLMPHEIGGLAAGTITPLALLWMVVAFFERGQQLRRETTMLRWHLRRLIYPSDHAQSRLNQITDSMRRQARDLTKASEDAARRGEAVTGMIKQRTVELSQV
jgi:hypothetical protein